MATTISSEQLDQAAEIIEGLASQCPSCWAKHLAAAMVGVSRTDAVRIVQQYQRRRIQRLTASTRP